MRVDYTLRDDHASGEVSWPDPLPFGQMRGGHMFVADYADGQWKNCRIVPYGPFCLAPGANVLHYGQAIFEGAKAFRHPSGELYAFRPEKNAARFNQSAETMCMPSIPVELQVEAMLRILDVDRKYYPSNPDSSMYIRPFMFGTEDSLGVKPSSTQIYCVFLSPSGPYYPGGLSKAIRLLVTTRFHRAAPGGTGTAKCAGNYGASLQAARQAYAHECQQVLYLDASNRFIDEAGTMNHFHITRDHELVIPDFVDTVLRSITSESIIELAPRVGLKPVLKRVPIEEFVEGVKSGHIVEAGGLGTAAVVSSVGSYVFDDGTELTVGDGKVGPLARKLYDFYTDMQYGRAPAPEGWLTKVPRYDKQ